MQINKELVPFAYAFLPRPAMRGRFLLVTNFRTGSHLLLDMLNQHPRITCDEKEWLLKKNKMKSAVRFLDGVSRRRRYDIYGCKISVRQLIRNTGDAATALGQLKDNNWQLVFLQRRNILGRRSQA